VFSLSDRVGLGLEMVTIDTYLSEWVPRQLRSRAFAFSFFIQFLSVPVLARLSWWLVPQTIFALSGWRWVVISGVTSALGIWFIRKKLPESPRWLVVQDRHLEAHHLITAMESRCGLPAKQPAPRSSENKQNAHGTIVTLSGQYRKRILLLVTMNIFQAIDFFDFGNCKMASKSIKVWPPCVSIVVASVLKENGCSRHARIRMCRRTSRYNSFRYCRDEVFQTIPNKRTGKTKAKRYKVSY
jgi:MFS family permease